MQTQFNVLLSTLRRIGSEATKATAKQLKSTWGRSLSLGASLTSLGAKAARTSVGFATNRKTTLSVGGTLGATVIAALQFWETPISQAGPTMMGGSLSSIGQVQFVTKTREGKISPLCGCYNEFPQAAWTGVSFAANSAKVSMKSENEWYWLRIEPPLPGEVAVGTNVEQSAKFITETVNGDGELETTISDDYWHRTLTILTNEPVIVRSDPTFPAMSWLPPSGSRTTISMSNEPNPRFNLLAETQFSESGTVGYHHTAMGVLDVFGPNIELELEGESQVLVGISTSARAEEFPDEIDLTKTKKIRLSTPFSSRIWFAPSEYSTLDEHWEMMDSDENEIVFAWNKKSEISILANEFMPLAEHIEMRRTLPQRTVVARSLRQSWQGRGVQDGIMTYRTPFHPPRLGFQIFGEMQSLELQAAKGDFMIGASPYPLNAPSELKLIDVAPIIRADGDVSQPITFDLDDGGDLDFQAISNVSINGVETQSRATIGHVISIIGLVLAMLIPIFQLVFRDKPSPSKSD